MKNKKPKVKFEKPNQEVSFWLVKIPPHLLRRVDDLRKDNGHNKKKTIERMARLYIACEGQLPDGSK